VELEAGVLILYTRRLSLFTFKLLFHG